MVRVSTSKVKYDVAGIDVWKWNRMLRVSTFKVK